MRITRYFTAGLAIAAVAGSVVFAASHTTPEGQAIAARKAHMALNQFNAGVLFGIAKGDIEFDADKAQAAANNLQGMASMNQSAYWLPGSSNADVENTRALPAIWEGGSQVMDILGDLRTATAAMAENAGSLDGVRANIGAVGEACTACHKLYRAPE